MKSVLISIRPEWCSKIATGKKTIEVRKSRPKLETPFKCYIYCTKGTDMWLVGIKGKRESQLLNGQIMGEFICDAVYPIQVSENGSITNSRYYNLYESCLSYAEMTEYIGVGHTGYAWHISNLVIYDKPKELSDFDKTRPPQSWCYAEHNSANVVDCVTGGLTMDYNEYLEKHSDSIFHYCLPAKPGTKVIVNSVSTNYKDFKGVVEKYEISKYGVVVQIVFNDIKQFMLIRPVTDFGKTIFICEEDNKK